MISKAIVVLALAIFASITAGVGPPKPVMTVLPTCALFTIHSLFAPGPIRSPERIGQVWPKTRPGPARENAAE